VSVAEGLDFGTPTGQFIRKILVLFAEWSGRQCASALDEEPRRA
jgi:hypothetical protein